MMLVTYLRNSENLTPNIQKAFDTLCNIYPDVKLVVFVGQQRHLDMSYYKSYQVINMDGTKYARLRYLMSVSGNEQIVSIDNDTNIVAENFASFIIKCKICDADIAWGKISTTKQKGFIANLVCVDKCLSHDTIRPLLWALGVGITIPGQCFFMKANDRFFSQMDTFLDDLEIGLFVNTHRSEIKVLYVPSIIALEGASRTAKELFNQRKRWAKGYLSVLNNVKTTREKRLVILHGFCYHLEWMVFFLCFFSMLITHPAAALIYLTMRTLFICRHGLSLFCYALAYQFIFPLFHIKWILSLLEARNDES